MKCWAIVPISALILTSLSFTNPAHAVRGAAPIRDMFSQRLASAEGQKLLYYGGKVISNVKVTAVFWGQGVNADVQAGISDFYTQLVNSTYMDWMSEYNTNLRAIDGRDGTHQKIGRGSYSGAVMITPGNSNKRVSDADVRNELAKQIADRKLPAPDANSIYMIHFPPDITIVASDGSVSCQRFCGYHDGFSDAAAASDVFYAILPDVASGACSFGCGSDGNAFNNSTSIASHELLEAVTDGFPTPGDKPAFPQAWNTSDGMEIGDLCAQVNTTLTTASRTYVVQQQWDNATTACAPGPYATN